MNGLTGKKSFYQADLKIINYHNKNISKNSNICSNKDYESFFICYIYEGKLDYCNSKGIFELNSGEMVLCMPYEKYQIICPPTKTAKFCIIQFEQNVISRVNSNLSLLRAFVDRKHEEKNIYKLSEFENSEMLKRLFETTYKYMIKNLDRPHFVALLQMILSEICVCFDTYNKTKVEKYSDEYEVRIYDYICRNTSSNITIDNVAEKFFVSKWYVNKLCYKFYNMPFKEMVVDMRMWHARDIISKNYVKLNKLYEMCGYKEYSGFYKAYKKFFGVKPKDDLNSYKNTGEFLTK